MHLNHTESGLRGKVESQIHHQFNMTPLNFSAEEEEKRGQLSLIIRKESQ